MYGKGGGKRACMMKGTCIVKEGMHGEKQEGMHDERGVHGKRGHAWQGGMHGKGACMARVVCVAGEMATEAGGMHPTRMHPCLFKFQK